MYSYMWPLWCVAQENNIITGLGSTRGYNHRAGERGLFFFSFILYLLRGVNILLLQAFHSGEQHQCHSWRSLSASLFALFWR